MKEMREMDIPKFMMRENPIASPVVSVDVLDTTTAAVSEKTDESKNAAVTQPELTNADKAKYADMVRGMNQEELELLLDYVPVSLCLKRISNELDKTSLFAQTIQSAFDILEK